MVLLIRGNLYKTALPHTLAGWDQYDLHGVLLKIVFAWRDLQDLCKLPHGYPGEIYIITTHASYL